ncbi:MAG TPA: VWA domain-containing protein [Anaerolineales bacterium]|jgi:VWFA-related protein
MNPTLRRLSQAFALLLLALWVLFPSAPALAQDEGPRVRITQVDNSKFPQVTVYVSVTDAAGEPVAVDPSQIQLSENGKLMNAQDAGGSGEIGPLTTLLVIDISGSMRQAGKLNGAKAAAKAYIEQMRPGDQAGLVTFNTQVKYVQPLTSDRSALAAAIDKLDAYDDTAMYDALAQGTEILKDVSGRKAIIVLTDGLDNVSKTTPESVIESIGPVGLSISTIGLGDPQKTGINSGLDETGLKTFSEKAGGVYSYANDPQTLQGLYKLYARALQSEYRIAYTSPAVLRDGANRTLSISLGRAGAAASSSAQVQYNPGGVLPEVAQSMSWPVFGAILAGLLVLLFVPLTIGKLPVRQAGAAPTSAKAKKPNIKLK